MTALHNKTGRLQYSNQQKAEHYASSKTFSRSVICIILGLLKQINDLLSTMRNEMIYESNVAKTGGNKKGFLQSERKLSPSALDELKRAWRELYSNNGDNMMVLNDGVKYQQAASTSVEMQLNEHKLTNSEMIALCCGLNPAVISGKAGTDEYMSAVRTSVLPVVEAFQAALNKSLLLETEKKALYFVLDTTELLKGDMMSRFNAYAVGLQNNFLRIDEVRYKENLPPIGFNYIKLGLQDVLLDPETGDIYTPNTNQMVNVGSLNRLTAGGEGGIIEERARHYIRGDHGRFNGSYSDGNDGGNGAGKVPVSGITKSEGGDVTISSIEKPIEQTHTGKSNPNAVLTFDVPLNNRQQELLDKLPGYDNRITVPRNAVNMADLSALTAKTGDEFAMFTKENERLIIRGNSATVNIHISDAKELAAQGYRWSGHTHPGTGINVLMPSGGDKTILMCFEQEISVIYNSKGSFATFGKE